MNKKDIFKIDYEIGSQRYLLTNAEIRCLDSSNSKKNFTMPLNLVQAYYSYGGSYAVQKILFIIYVGIGVSVFLMRSFYGTQRHDALLLTKLIIFSLMAMGAAWFYYKNKKKFHAYQFYHLEDGTPAFSIPVNSKTKDSIQPFLTALVNRIHQTTPANDHALFLLERYSLLTNSEYTQLETNILHHQIEEKPTSNVIPLQAHQ
jgi:hypothetical protein